MSASLPSASSCSWAPWSALAPLTSRAPAPTPTERPAHPSSGGRQRGRRGRKARPACPRAVVAVAVAAAAACAGGGRCHCAAPPAPRFSPSPFPCACHSLAGVAWALPASGSGELREEPSPLIVWQLWCRDVACEAIAALCRPLAPRLDPSPCLGINACWGSAAPLLSLTPQCQCAGY